MVRVCFVVLFRIILYILTRNRFVRADEVNLIETLEKLLQRAAYAHWSLAELGDELKKASIEDEHASIFAKFWQSERDNIHKFLQSKQFNGHLEVHNNSLTPSLYTLITHYSLAITQRAAWRIDIQTATKRKDEMNKPVAIMELNVKKPDESIDCVQFEMERDELSGLLKKFDAIAGAIQKRS